MENEREEKRKREIPGWKDEFDGRPQRPEESFGEFLDGKAARNKDKPYLYSEDRVVTYGELKDKVSRAANAFLDLGIKRGEKLAVMMYNRPGFLYTVYAAETIAAIHVGINIALKGEGLSYIINQSDSETLVIEQEFLEGVEFVKQDLKQLKRIVVLPIAEEKGSLPAGYISFEELYQSSDKTPLYLPATRRNDPDSLHLRHYWLT